MLAESFQSARRNSKWMISGRQSSDNQGLSAQPGSFEFASAELTSAELGDPFGQPRYLPARRILMDDAFLDGPHDDGLGSLQGLDCLGSISR